MKMYDISDWTGAKIFGDATFESFDDAEQYLSDYLGDTYEDERGEYYVLPVDLTPIEEGDYYDII